MINKTNEKGITLIELLVSLALVSLLVVGAMGVYYYARNAYAINNTQHYANEYTKAFKYDLKSNLRMARGIQILSASAPGAKTNHNYTECYIWVDRSSYASATYGNLMFRQDTFTGTTGQNQGTPVTLVDAKAMSDEQTSWYDRSAFSRVAMAPEVTFYALNYQGNRISEISPTPASTSLEGTPNERSVGYELVVNKQLIRVGSATPEITPLVNSNSAANMYNMIEDRGVSIAEGGINSGATLLFVPASNQSTVTTSGPVMPTACCTTVAVYGEDGQETGIMREFRDRFLMSSTPGKIVVWLYYNKVSPAVIGFIGDSQTLKTFAAWLLRPIVWTAYLLVNYPLPTVMTVLMMTLAWWWRRRNGERTRELLA